MTPKTLSRTLVIKERLRQVRRAELHEAQTRVSEAQHWVDEEQARQDGTRALITRAGEFSANELAQTSEQLAASNRELKRVRSELGAREAEREQRQEIMGEATREVRAIEALRERLMAELRRAADKREQSELDEAASRKSRAQS